MNIDDEKDLSIFVRMNTRSLILDPHSYIWQTVVKDGIGVEYAFTIILAAASEKASDGTPSDVIELINQMLGYRDICNNELTTYLYNCSNRVVLPSAGKIQFNRVIYDAEKPEDLYVDITYTQASFFTES